MRGPGRLGSPDRPVPEMLLPDTCIMHTFPKLIFFCVLEKYIISSADSTGTPYRKINLSPEGSPLRLVAVMTLIRPLSFFRSHDLRKIFGSIRNYFIRINSKFCNFYK